MGRLQPINASKIKHFTMSEAGPEHCHQLVTATELRVHFGKGCTLVQGGGRRQSHLKSLGVEIVTNENMGRSF
jgi:hypothetical protein